MTTQTNLRSLPLMVLMIVGCQTAAPPTAEQATGTVTVEVVGDDGIDRYEINNVAAGTTVESLMQSIEQIPVTVRGSGVTAFVEAIDSQSTSSSHGWTFKVDGKFANQGIGSTTLTPPATVTWSFADASEIVQD